MTGLARRLLGTLVTANGVMPQVNLVHYPQAAHAVANAVKSGIFVILVILRHSRHERSSHEHRARNRSTSPVYYQYQGVK